jgi:hypothetical protein
MHIIKKLLIVINSILFGFRKRILALFVAPETKKPVVAPKQQEISIKIDPRPEAIRSIHHELVLNKNPFGHKNVVLYYEPRPYPLINQYLREHHGLITERLQNKNISFINPTLFNESSSEDLSEILDYYFPDLSGNTPSPSTLIQKFSSVHFFRELIGFEVPQHPCFIRSTNEQDGENFIYRVFYLPDQDEEMIQKSVEFYLSVVAYAKLPFKLQFSKGGRDFDSKDPDTIFQIEDNELSNILKSEIEKELIKNSTKGALRMLVFLLKQMREYDIPAHQEIKKFIAEIQYPEEKRLSPVIISSTGKIILKDFRKEVELTPLQKTVFIFFLLKEEGIMFKNLPQYKNELMSIYSKVSNRTSMETIRKSINDLVNPYSNSMSEKCSRIKEAFIKCMDDRVARYYYITGYRSEPKRIILDRKLVVFEDSVY